MTRGEEKFTMATVPTVIASCLITKNSASILGETPYRKFPVGSSVSMLDGNLFIGSYNSKPMNAPPPA